MADAAELREQLVEELCKDGSLTSPAWIDAFRAMPRERFVPRYFTFADGGGHTPVDESDCAWLAPIYADRVLPTQLGGDSSRWEQARRTGQPAPGEPTCSLTMPSLTALMLEALDVHDGDRVLEVGAGTGYNAGLLAARLGDSNVTTIDVDPTLTTEARQHLRDAGYAPRVLTGDGTRRVQQATPFDRIIATCSVPAVPPAWIEQTRPKGIILTNLHRDLARGFLVRLTVEEDGRAVGSVLDSDGFFMAIRSHPEPDIDTLLRAASHGEDGIVRPTTVTFDPQQPQPWHLLADALLAGVATVDLMPPSREPLLWLLHADGSWAVHNRTTGQVEQYGPGRLWDTIENAHDTWVRLGRPSRDRFGLTVEPDGRHRLWLDEPDGPTVLPLLL